MQLSVVLSVLVAGKTLALPVPGFTHAAPFEAQQSRAKGIFKRETSPLNSLLSLVVKLFPVNIAVCDVTGLISTAEQGLADVLSIDTTQNGLAGKSSGSNRCATVAIIFARGTTEAGNVGALVGPQFFDAVQQRLGGGSTLAVQGVDYPADVPGFLSGGDAAGSQTM